MSGENETSAMVTCVILIRGECKQVSGNFLEVKIGNNWRTFNETFVNSMEDAKRPPSKDFFLILSPVTYTYQEHARYYYQESAFQKKDQEETG